MFLHNDKELFKDVVTATAEDQRRPVAIVEKDYYVTMILKLLAQSEPTCVFKGGTSVRGRCSQMEAISGKLHLNS